MRRIVLVMTLKSANAYDIDILCIMLLKIANLFLSPMANMFNHFQFHKYSTKFAHIDMKLLSTDDSNFMRRIVPIMTCKGPTPMISIFCVFILQNSHLLFKSRDKHSQSFSIKWN